MREILFRGKRVDNGEWVCGDICHHDGKTSYIGQDQAGEMVILDLDPDTVGQFTGLVDMRKTRIFEGDIVDCWSEGVNAKGTVQQRKDGLWIIYPAWQKHIMWGLCPDEYLNTTVEVIGNVHDNPELMGGVSNA